MPCSWIRIPDGKGGFITAHVKHARAPKRKCFYCGQRTADRQCDGPPSQTPLIATGAGVPTCDRHICARCSIHVPPDQDYCARNPPCHAAALEAGRQLRERGRLSSSGPKLVHEVKR